MTLHLPAKFKRFDLYDGQNFYRSVCLAKRRWDRRSLGWASVVSVNWIHGVVIDSREGVGDVLAGVYNTWPAWDPTLFIMQNLSWVCFRHSLGVQWSQIQKPMCLQHLQKQHEQQMHVIKITKLINTLAQVPRETWKYSNFFFSSFRTMVSISSILALTKLRSSTDDKIFSRGTSKFMF